MTKYVFVIANETAAKVACDRLQKEEVLFVDCEGKEFGNFHSEIGLVQIADDRNNCYIFDVKSCEECLTILKRIFESSDIHKVFHDCSGDIAALLAVADIKVKNVGDTQIAQHFVKNPVIGYDWNHIEKCSLDNLYVTVTNRSFPYINVHTYGANKWLDRRPLTNRMVQYAAVDALVLPQIYEIQQYCFPQHFTLEYKLMIENSISSKCDKIAAIKSTYSEIPASSRATIESSSSMGVWGTVGLIGASVLAAAVFVKTEMEKKECEEKRKKEEQQRRSSRN